MSSAPTTPPAPRGARPRRLGTGCDWIFLTVIIGIPLAALLFFVRLPALASLGCPSPPGTASTWPTSTGSACRSTRRSSPTTRRSGPAVRHNVIWLLFTALLPTPFGIFLAYQLDRKIRFTRIYQTANLLPMVLSLAVVGFIWEIIYNPDTGLLNGIRAAGSSHHIDWLGNPDLNLWAVLVASSWRHTGYIMILYLAGLKGFSIRCSK